MSLSKQNSLWHSYEQKLDHIGQANQHSPHHKKIYLSRARSLTPLVIFVTVTASASLLIGLLLLRSPTVMRYQEIQNFLDLQQQLSYLLVFYSLYMLAAVVALVIKHLVFSKQGRVFDLIILGGLLLIFTAPSLLYSFQPIAFAVNLLLCLVLVIFAKFFFKSYSYSGINYYLATCTGVIIGLVWGINFFSSMPASTLTKAILLAGSPLLLITLPSKFLHMLEMYDIVCKEHWIRPRHSFPKDWITHEPFVSIHVPT